MREIVDISIVCVSTKVVSKKLVMLEQAATMQNLWNRISMLKEHWVYQT
jgi:hypothetical protein